MPEFYSAVSNLEPSAEELPLSFEAHLRKSNLGINLSIALGLTRMPSLIPKFSAKKQLRAPNHPERNPNFCLMNFTVKVAKHRIHSKIYTLLTEKNRRGWKRKFFKAPVTRKSDGFSWFVFCPKNWDWTILFPWKKCHTALPHLKTPEGHLHALVGRREGKCVLVKVYIFGNFHFLNGLPTTFW